MLAFAQKAGGEGWVSGKKFDHNTMLVLANGNGLDFRTPPDLTAAALTVDSKVFAHYLHLFDASNSFDIADEAQVCCDSAICLCHASRKYQVGDS